MTDRELMQQALEALEWNLPVIEDYGDHEQLNRQHRAIIALRERLAQPEQEQWDAIPDTFNEWWDADYDDTGNPYRKDSPAYWAWSGWKAASKQPEQESERNKLAAWMMQRSYATGHGDTMDDLLKELEWQVIEREREACAKVCEEEGLLWGQRYAAAIRARGNA